MCTNGIAYRLGNKFYWRKKNEVRLFWQLPLIDWDREKQCVLFTWDRRFPEVSVNKYFIITPIVKEMSCSLFQLFCCCENDTNSHILWKNLRAFFVKVRRWLKSGKGCIFMWRRAWYFYQPVDTYCPPLKLLSRKQLNSFPLTWPTLDQWNCGKKELWQLVYNNNICTPKDNRVQRSQVPWFLPTDAVTKIVNFLLNFIVFLLSNFY